MSIKSEKKANLSDFECDMVAGDQILLIYWDLPTPPSAGFIVLGLKRENIQGVAVLWVEMPCL